MKKFLLMAALVAAAGVLVKFRLAPALKSPGSASSPQPSNASAKDHPPQQTPPQPAPDTDGMALYHQGQYAEAARLLEAEIQEMERKDAGSAVKHIEALARCYEFQNLAQKAVEAWKRVLANPASDKVAVSNAYYYLGRNCDDPEERRKYQALAGQGSPESEGTSRAIMDQMLPLLDQEGKEYEARGALSKLLREGSLPAEQANKAREALMKANQRLVFSQMPTPDSSVYRVQHGDTLTRIALEHKTTVGLLRRVNGLSSDRLQQNQSLKVISCDGCELFVSKTDLKLSLWLKGHFIKEYDCCVGAQNTPTPPGDFTIEKRQVDPMWRGLAANDPKNILGSRWLGLNPPRTDIGVHGTTEPETVPGRKSAGCVRMRNADVEEVYDFAIEKTQVHIRP